jgi:hypothetical protein
VKYLTITLISPEQVIDKVRRYHERFAPVLNRSIPDPPWPAVEAGRELTGAAS